MDGTLAVIFLATSLTDMVLSDCPTGCLARSEAPAQIAYQVGEVAFQDDDIGTEVYLGYHLGYKAGPFQPSFGLSVTQDGSTWAGAGARWTSEQVLGGPVFFEASLMPGFYVQGDGVDLGGNLQFRSRLGVGVKLSDTAAVSVGYDHRSNADTDRTNPGLEVLSLRFTTSF